MTCNKGKWFNVFCLNECAGRSVFLDHFFFFTMLCQIVCSEQEHKYEFYKISLTHYNVALYCKIYYSGSNEIMNLIFIIVRKRQMRLDKRVVMGHQFPPHSVAFKKVDLPAKW